MGESSRLAGRADELAAVEAAVAQASPCWLLASPGMGKTTVLNAAVADLRAQGYSVIHARPTEVERALEYSTLAAVLDRVPTSSYDTLPSPQRRAVRAALLLEEADGSVDRRAVAAGLAGLLLQSERTLLVIDDAQWVDAASRTALHMALRMPGVAVGVVTASRPVPPASIAWIGEDAVLVELGGMAPGELHQVVRSQVGVSLDPARLRQVVAGAGGNPLHAIELARAGDANESTTLDELLMARVWTLPVETRSLLLLAALAADRSLDVLAEASGQTAQDVCGHLHPARTDGLVDLEDRVRFRHPLFEYAVVSAAAQPEILSARLALAHADDANARLLHRSALSTGPDAELATELHMAALAARARGAWDGAITMLRQAVSGSGGEQDGNRRLLLGEWLTAGGQLSEAESELRMVAASGSTSELALAQLLLARICTVTGRPDEAGELIAALQRDDVDPAIRISALLNDPMLRGGDGLFANAELAEQLLDHVDDPAQRNRLRAQCLAARARCLAWRSESADAVLQEALDNEHTIVDLLGSAEFLAGFLAQCRADYDMADQTYRRLAKMAGERCDEVACATFLAYAAYNHLMHAHWVELDRDAADALVAEGMSHVAAPVLQTYVAAGQGLRGDVEGSRERLAVTARRLANAGPLLEAHARSFLAEVLIADARFAEAGEVLREAVELLEASGISNPGILGAETDSVEVDAVLGRHGDAEQRLASVEERAGRAGRPNVLANCARARVVLLAEQGRLDEAVERVEAMLATYAVDHHRPWDLARAHLVAGQVLRRTRHRTRAAAVLNKARDIAERHELNTLLVRIRTELDRVGTPGERNELTGTERQVAGLAADGLRNNEIAAQLYLSVKSVEGALTRCYRKLGVRSRIELTRVLEDVRES